MKNSVILIVGLVLVSLFTGCRKEKEDSQQNPNFEFVDATMDQVLKLEEIVAILILDYDHPDTAHKLMLIGNPVRVEEIVGKKYQFARVYNDQKWVLRIHYGYKEAIKESKGKSRESPGDARVVFLTEEKGYMLEFNYDGEVVYNEQLQSKRLFRDLEQIDFIEHEAYPTSE